MAPESALQSILGTWKLVSYVREVFGSNERFNQFGENPAGYLGYSVDGRMYAIFVRQDRITPGDVVPTDVKLLGTMVAYAGKFTLDGGKVVHHIDVSWHQAWTGTDQVRYYTELPVSGGHIGIFVARSKKLSNSIADWLAKH